MHANVAGLSREISYDILHCSNANKTALQDELEQLHSDAATERNPDVAYATLLYRKYSTMLTGSLDKIKGSIASIQWLDVALNDDSVRLQLRAATTVLALITFAVMASAPYIRHREFNVNHHFYVSHYAASN
jgi:hypothetical protein